MLRGTLPDQRLSVRYSSLLTSSLFDLHLKWQVLIGLRASGPHVGVALCGCEECAAGCEGLHMMWVYVAHRLMGWGLQGYSAGLGHRVAVV